MVIALNVFGLNLNSNKNMENKYEPKDINKDIDTGIELASFDYYTGIAIAKKKGLEQTTSFSDVNAGTHFIVCCGDVMFKVNPIEFVHIQRRLI